jgi:hypothetical protein
MQYAEKFDKLGMGEILMLIANCVNFGHGHSSPTQQVQRIHQNWQSPANQVGGGSQRKSLGPIRFRYIVTLVVPVFFD